MPWACLAGLTGFAFGLAGVMFQTMLRNALASPDVIGISTGASAAAVYTIVMLSVHSMVTVSTVAIVAALLTAGLIYLLAYSDGVSGSRLILVGIGVAAMLNSVVGYVLLRASNWDLRTSMRWLTGSLHGGSWRQVLPVAVAVAVWSGHSWSYSATSWRGTRSTPVTRSA